MAVTERVMPYAQRLMEDEEIQANLRSAIGSGKSALGRARRKGEPKKVVSDAKIRKQVLAAGLAGREAVAAIRKPSPKPKRRWLKRLLIVGLLTGGAYLAGESDARDRFIGLLGGHEGAAGAA